MRFWQGVVAVAAIASIAVVTVAAGKDNIPLSMISVSVFATVIIVTACRLNVTALAKDNGPNARADLSSLNAGLLASAFAWGGMTILAGYYLTDLFWHHAWQYGLGMCLAGLMSYGMRWHLLQPQCFLCKPHWQQRLTLLSGLLLIGSGAGLVFLLGSGKLAAINPDWLANHVFVAGGLAVMALSAIAVWAQLKAKQA